MSKIKDNPSKTLDFFDKITAQLPEFFARNSIDELTGKVFTGRHLANLMSKGEGPTGTRIGNKVVIFREDFRAWLKSRYKSNI